MPFDCLRHALRACHQVKRTMRSLSALVAVTISVIACQARQEGIRTEPSTLNAHALSYDATAAVPAPTSVERSTEDGPADGGCIFACDSDGTPSVAPAGTKPCDNVRGSLVYAPTWQEFHAIRCDEGRCRAAGGRCAYAGMACPIACVKRTSDGGKACRDGSECKSRLCEGTPDTAVGTPMTGKCADVVMKLGCSVMVKQGRVESTICGD